MTATLESSQKSGCMPATACDSVASSVSWRRIRVGDTLRLVNGAAFKPTDWTETGLPIVRIQNLNNPDAPFNLTTREIPEKFRLRGGELLFAWSGTPGTSFGAHIWRGGDAWLNQHIFNVHFDEREWDKRFLQFAINQNLSEYIRAAHGGAGLAHITKGRFEESELVQPPIPEQCRIVAEIEQQFTRLDAGVTALRRVQTNLKCYRAAVLKAACEGRLVPTEAELARKENRTFETGEQLLQRILTERRKNWNGRGKYKDPTTPDTASLPPLPEGWTWASADQLAAETMIGLDRGRSQQSDDPSFGVPYIKMNNVTMEGRVLYDDMVYVPADKEESERFAVQDGDILFNTRNSKELVGKVGIVRDAPDGTIYNNNLMRIRVSTGVTSAFLCLQMCSHEFRRRMELVKKATTNIAAVYAKDLLPLPIALPPLAEQIRIVAEVERRLSMVEKLESVVLASLQRATHLRQSILQKAFTGEF